MGKKTSQVTAAAVTTTTPARLIKLLEKKTTGESHSRNVLIPPGTPLRQDLRWYRVSSDDCESSIYKPAACECDTCHKTPGIRTPESDL
jgi:hypothetical protein